MSFEYSSYWIQLVGNALVFAVFGVIALLWGIIVHMFPNRFTLKKSKIKLFRKNRKLHLYWSIISFILLCMISIRHMNKDLLFEKESDSRNTNGVITNIEPANADFKLYKDGSRIFPDYITINNVRYYIMDIGEFEVGDQVDITYLPKSKIILSIYETNDET